MINIAPAFLLVIMMVIPLAAPAQITQLPGEVRVKAGEDARKVIPRKERYRYDNFELGNLYFFERRDSARKSPVYRLNYNFLLGEMQALTPAYDTVNVQNVRTLKFIRLGADLYYNDYDKGYFELLNPDDPVRLALQRRLILLRHEMQGSNGYTSIDNSSMAIVGSRYSQPSNTRYILNEDGIYIKKTVFFLMDQYDVLTRLTKSEVLSAFPKYKIQIRDYLKENRVDFYKEEDLLRLIRFCNGLASSH